ncbi:DNA alkylation repair protein [Aureitalea marina]|uniref:DNA alkylation repair protein n=1 Tax=Aureitalea marina TaxID=930804 RepID=A0A2S7KRP2_9FLAO|nr:DNA alkylation repair protein [Aureitalea marina]PQB05291.1 hypothetical protein BST85_10655 [Aureitalea marina]
MTRAYVEPVREVLNAQSNPDRAKGQTAYMRNQFEFFGLTAGERRKALAPFLNKNTLPEKSDLHQLVHRLWKEPQREFQYFGQELVAKFKRHLDLSDIPLLEFMITHKSWWDTVDFIATHLVGIVLANYPKARGKLCDNWFESGNIWLQRTGLLFQLKYKDLLDTELLSRQIDRLKDSKEFFIRKAIGWILREYSKTNPNWVRQFVSDRPELSNLSRREALRLNNKN